MDQLFSTFGINWQLLAIQIVNFVALLSLLTYFLYKPVMKMLDEREKLIAKGVSDAQAAETKLAEADTEARSIIGKGAKDAEVLVAEARASAEKKGGEIVALAEEKAAAAQRDAIALAGEKARQIEQAAEKTIARAAMLAAEKILREKTAK